MNLQTITREEIAEIYGVQPTAHNFRLGKQGKIFKTAARRQLSLVGENS